MSLSEADHKKLNNILMNAIQANKLHMDTVRRTMPIAGAHWYRSDIEMIVREFVNDAIAERFDAIEFALDEEGRPDGIKNYQEVLLTVASDIAEKISELAFEGAKNVLSEDDSLQVKAMMMLKESKED